MQPKPAETPFDGQIEALGHVTRRRLLHELLRSPAGTVDVEDDRYGASTPVLMRHVHLPKLEEMGYVSTDAERELVKRGLRFDEIAPLLELLDRHDDELPVEWL